jgi:hypothetical protein
VSRDGVLRGTSCVVWRALPLAQPEGTHEVSISCSCDDIEQCETERYIADIRLALAEIESLKIIIDVLLTERQNH